MIDDRRMRVIHLAFITTFRQILLLCTHPPTALACKYRSFVLQNSTLVMPELVLQPQRRPTIEVLPGFTFHTENTTHILLPSDNGAFLNPLRQGNSSGKVSSVFCLVVVESLACLLRYVIANDLSDAATEVMRKKVEMNGFSEKPCRKILRPKRLSPREMHGTFFILHIILPSKLIQEICSLG